MRVVALVGLLATPTGRRLTSATFGTLLALGLLGLGFASGARASSAFDVPARLHLDAVRSDRTSYAPGETARIEVAARIDADWHVNSDTPTYDFLIPTTLVIGLPEGWPAPLIEWPTAAERQFSFAEVPLSVFDGSFPVAATLLVPADATLGTLTLPLTLGYQACDYNSCEAPTEATLSVDLIVGASGSPTPALQVATGGTKRPSAAVTAPNLLVILVFGLLGGLILNLMPCVLPVLSLKVFGLVRAAGHGRGEVRRGALATSAGIVASFLALATVAVFARNAGAAVGWGVQFQQPAFVAFLLVIIVLFALNLWGVFEITLPGAIADAADASSQREGLSGHFASGLFATLMATPCSAPFLGTAVSFALGQPASTTFLVFAAVGVGMALPYLLLAANPGAAKWLPRPGRWMDTLKGVLGFLLAGAGVWLLYVLAALVTSLALAAIHACLLLLALAVWLRSRSTGATGRWVWLVAAVAVAGGTMVLAARAPVSGPSTPSLGSPGPSAAGGISWIPFDEDEAIGLASEGRFVFVDVTADWCLTCKVNEQLILARPEVAAAFAEHQVIAMKADWTRRDDTIAAFLARHGRSGIPFYVLYRPEREPHVFGEVLSVDVVVDAVAGG